MNVVGNVRIRRRMWTTATLVAMWLFPLLSSVRAADPMPVPMDLQVQILKRILGYDKTLATQASPIVFVVYQDEGTLTRVDPVNAFKTAGIVSMAVPLDGLASQSQTPAAIYLLPDVDSSTVGQYCADNAVLSLSGVPGLAVGGSVSVSIGEADSRPEIIVNMSRLRVEGHEFSAQLLKLARVIR